MRALFHDPVSDTWLLFRRPLGVLVVGPEALASIPQVLEEADYEIQRSHRYAAGWLAYEAAPAFDPAFRIHPPRGPLLCVGIFDPPEHVPLPPPRRIEPPSLTPELDEKTYLFHLSRIKEALEAGITYQVNYTFRLEGRSLSDPLSLFLSLVNRSAPSYSAYVEAGDHAVLSFSPELFFRKHRDLVECEPMKGTSRRGTNPDEDAHLVHRLHTSEKNRAENLMIVDMIRNDLGKIAAIGTVEVPHLFSIRTIPYAHQMVSTVRARTSASIPRILEALFPCASITGAPKASTMSIIAREEHSPRGVYTGTVGFWSRETALFNVAIRTLVKDGPRWYYGTGGGIVWDSDPGEEYLEALLKVGALGRPLASPCRPPSCPQR
ncbi:chorismate-binding protein [Spirochaeta thermophila]|uniref:Chorismate-utilising enzyme C-terminal domain-containing protein n=1 Tax=Winmispira thermophila (strain ATCC 49972 / DSM 6192 / RI 19.B1) TaxID=665571 RepID=E0RT73_WINT6|nr:chorismate-binding protein [Spirochaeta thermophila]ADN02369.1 hypothetical protein STHERM_c14290 [Spirochaeta thermophila DSM 6192]